MAGNGLIGLLNSGVDIFGKVQGVLDTSRTAQANDDIYKKRADAEYFANRKAYEDTQLEKAKLDRENSALFIAFKWIGGAVAAAVVSIFVGMALDQFRKKRKA